MAAQPSAAGAGPSREAAELPPLVDSHHHLWDLQQHYPWLQENAGELAVHGDDAAIRRDYLVADYLADVGDLPLLASVHVDAGAADPIAEARWLQQLADTAAASASGHPAQGLPQAIVAGAKLADPDVSGTLDELVTLPNVRGIRDILNWHPDPALSYIDRSDLITDPQWLAGFAMLEPRGLSFDLQAYPEQLPAAARLAADHPSTAIIVNHAGMPVDRSEPVVDQYLAGLAALAAQDNVLMKISGIGMTDHLWAQAGPGALAPVVQACIDAFTPARCMFGSNFPVDSLYSTYRELYQAFDILTVEHSPDERADMFGRVAAAAYRIRT